MQVAWDVFFKYPFIGSYIAAYIPLKALAAGLVMLASYLLWRRSLDEGLARRIYATAFAATLAYFLLAYVDLATFEFATREGTPAWCTSYNLCGSAARASQVFITPNPTSFIAWGAWSSALLTLITLLAAAAYIALRPLRPIADLVVKYAGPPVATVAGLYTSFLYIQWTARGVLVDSAYVVLFALYMFTAAFLALAAFGHAQWAKAGAYGAGFTLAFYVAQLFAYALGLYRQDALEAWTLMVAGRSALLPAEYGAVSGAFWAGIALSIVSVALAIVGARLSSKAAAAGALGTYAVGIALVEFARLISAQLVPNS